MTYLLQPTQVDALTIGGTYNAKRVTVTIHGRASAAGAGVTSTDLITNAVRYQANIVAAMTACCPGYVVTDLMVQQVRQWRWKFGRPPIFRLLFGAGNPGPITGVVIVDAGSGLRPEQFNLQVWDPTGFGAEINAVITLDSVSMTNLFNGGLNYSAGAVAQFPRIGVNYRGVFGRGDRLVPYETVYNAQDIVTGLAIPGTYAAGDSLPTICSYGLKLRSSFPGRDGRGQNHITGIPEAATLLSYIDPAQLMALQNGLANLYAPVAMAGGAFWIPGVFSRNAWHKYAPGVPASSSPFISTVGTVVLSNKVRGMQSRRIR